MRHLAVADLSVREAHQLLLGGVAPRPIALVSTISPEGINNLTPFSFFNAFGANPPTVAFSPSRRGRDGTLKDTYNNIKETPECVISAVTYDMVQQSSLASTEYPADVDEFIKSGLTPVASDLVKPPRVEQSPFSMECKVINIVDLGGGPASGNLIICEVLKFHVAERVFTNDVIDPSLIDLVGRNSANYYTRAHGDAVFEVAKPIIGQPGVGYDQLPEFFRQSTILTANNLGQLGNVETKPTADDVAEFIERYEPIEATGEQFDTFEYTHDWEEMLRASLHQKNSTEWFERTARAALAVDKVDEAWKIELYAASLSEQEQ